MPRIDEIDRRTDVVFILFYFADTIHGVTKVQKLLFLIEKETQFFEEYQEDVAFNFAPYKMGPFSESVYEELQFLLQLNAIKSEPLENASSMSPNDSDLSNKQFTITRKGEKIASQLVELLESEYQDELEQIIDEYNARSLTELLRYIYTEYPGYTTESEIRDDLFQGAD